MNRWQIATVLFAASLVAAAPAVAQNEGQGQGQAVVTVLPKSDKQPTAADVPSQSLNLTVDGKRASLTNWRAARGDQAPVEFVLLIDDGARVSLGREWDDITHFLGNLPPNVKATVAYMENGRAVLSGPLTSDRAKLQQEFHLPTATPGYSASPYFCLSDLAKNWPSQDPTARREVVMVTDGVDYYQLRYDPDDPYMLSAINDAVRAHVVVYSIYWVNKGRIDRTWYENNAGQNLLAQVTQATGGKSYWEGFGDPVSFAPYFKDLRLRFRNQYEVGFTAPLKGKPDVERFDLKVGGLASAKVSSPQQVFVQQSGMPASGGAPTGTGR